MEQTTILIADDHPLFRDALRLAVARAAPHATVLEAASTPEAVSQSRSVATIDLIMLDLRMPGANGFTGLAQLHAERPDTPIIVVSAVDQADVSRRAREYGAIGFLHKGADLSTIEQAVRSALAGHGEEVASYSPAPREASPTLELDAMARRIASLTPAQLKVLFGLLEGRLNKQIAYDMSISEATVKAHMTAVFRKLNVRNRTQAVLAAKALNLEPDEVLV